jgi:uncharacterized repeat protein (TIGR03803 family)
VTIPNSVTSIGSYAFSECSSLTSVTIPDSVTSIGAGAFEFCSGLTNVTIPNSVTSIGSYAFDDCSRLANVTFGSGVTNIGVDAFFDCSGLTSVTIPDSVTSIGDSSFFDCYGVTNVTFGSGVTNIGVDAFYGCSSLTSVTIPGSVTNVGTYAFSYCHSLTNAIIENGVTSLGADAFYACSKLNAITIPGSVTNIGNSAFYACTSLTAITVDTNNPAYSSAAGVLFNQSQTMLILCPEAVGGSYTVPDSVTNIGNSAFQSCSSLGNVFIGSSVQSIGNSAFQSCTSLTSIVIPNSVISIGNNAFSSCIGLTNITIGNSVTSIGDAAFYGCSSLSSVAIPGSVANIGVGPFEACTSLMAITVDASNPAYTVVAGVLLNQSQTTLIQCPALLAGSYAVPNSVTNIGNYAFSSCSGLTNITIPNNVNAIGVGAFQFCTKLASIAIPNSILSIGNSTFQSCTSLKSITIPNSVTNIGSSAFNNCTSLTTITIGSSVTNIGNYAFGSCISLWQIYFLGNCPSIGTSAFSGVSYYGRVYFAPDQTGWGSTFSGLPTYAWIPLGGADYSNLGAQIQTVYNFQSGDNGAAPYSAVTLGPDGNYYGTTYAGGSNYCGTIFRMDGNGNVSTILSFNHSNGANPYASLTLGGDGCLYGTTTTGGMTNALNTMGFGTVFKVTTNGDLTTLAFFNQTNGANPWAGLAWGGDGYFYGTTMAGGITNASLPSGYGTIFRMDTNGSLSTLAMFRGTTNGYEPAAGLTWGIDGDFYGTTWGGTNGTGTGTLFRITTNGAFNMLFVFGGTNGSSPNALTMGNDGNLYGTTSTMLFRLDTNAVVTVLTTFGSTNIITTLTPASDTGFYGTGTKGIFRVGIDGSITNIFSFNSPNGNPKAPVVLKADGAIVGTTPDGGAYGLGTVYQLNSDGSLSTIFSFANTPGARPKGLTIGPDGEIYGTTSGGGTFGGGSFYKIGIDGVLKSLYSFDPYYTDGAMSPTITLGGDGNFYGTTYAGGDGYGTVFRLTTNGLLKTLHSFTGTDGEWPSAPLTLGNDENFYGTTISFTYTTGSGLGNGDGTIFQITTNGTLTTLYSFGMNSTVYDEASPEAALTLGNDGNFYGTTQRGGYPGFGVVFEVVTNGTFTTVASFSGTNGASPQSPLRLTRDANFYGVAYGGYTNNTYPEGMGTIYKTSTNGKITALYRFPFSTTNGIHPVDLTMGSDGFFYGVTIDGGVSTSLFTGGMGTIFRISTNGAFTTLATFDPTTGARPNCTLIQGSDGNFYGTTYSGGVTNSAYSFGMGTVFRLLLPPAVLSQPISQSKAVGATALFQVSVTSLNQVTYQWQKNGTNITDNGNVVGATTSMLTISDVSQDDAAIYSVVVSNANFSISRSNATLTVFLPPQGFSASIANGNQIALHLNGTTNYPYILQSATNLTPPVNWQPVLTNPADGNGNWQFMDTNLNGSQKFYRAVGQ